MARVVVRRVGRGNWGAVSLAVGLTVTACGEPPPPAPSAVIRACPAAVCLGDDHTTWLHLDAKKSEPRLTLTGSSGTEEPLELRWSFSGSDWAFVDMDLMEDDLSADEIQISMVADRPLHVTLRVQNAVGGVAEALKTLAVTPLSAQGTCPLPLPEQDESDDCLAIGAAE